MTRKAGGLRCSRKLHKNEADEGACGSKLPAGQVVRRAGGEPGASSHLWGEAHSSQLPWLSGAGRHAACPVDDLHCLLGNGQLLIRGYHQHLHRGSAGMGGGRQGQRSSRRQRFR